MEPEQSSHLQQKDFYLGKWILRVHQDSQQGPLLWVQRWPPNHSKISYRRHLCRYDSRVWGNWIQEPYWSEL